MPVDPDEDLVLTTVPPTAPRPQWKPATPLAAAAAPATGFAWGVVGFLHETAELTTTPGSRGVVRFVNDDVSYLAPPAGGWKPTPGTPGRYEMPWPGDVAAARTLTQLRADLDQGGRTGALKSANSPLLAELDGAADGLLAAAGKLHAAGWTLGLVNPANVALSASHEPHLVDLGFTWKGSFGAPPWDASPGRPAWLDDSAKWLSDIPAVRRQFADPSGVHFPRVEPVEDVRTLARLFAWLLTGKPTAEVVAPSRAPAPELWTLLTEASNGKVPTAKSFRDRLRDNPLSSYFTAPLVPVIAPKAVTPPPTAPAKKSPLPALAGVAVLALGIGFGAYFLWPSNAEITAVTPPTTDVTPPPTAVVPPVVVASPRTPEEFAAELKKLDEALVKNELPEAVKVLKEVYAPGVVTPADEAARQQRREQYVALCIQEYKACLALAASPSRRFDAVARLRAVESQLKSLADAPPLPPEAATLREKEKQCLELASQLARQLSS